MANKSVPENIEMLSIAVKTAAGAVSYYIHMQGEASNKEASTEDYYAAEGVGYWAGAACEQLGVSCQVTPEQFSALCNGFDANGQPLVQNAGDSDRRAGWDCTFSAPKSVSLVWANADKDTREAIEKAHAQSVEKGLEFIQDKASYSRRGKEGHAEEEADIAVAVFQHGTSRERDPQLHSHAFVVNAAVREDGTVGTLQGRHFFDWKMAAGALYRAELASEMQKLGYAVERDGSSFRLTDVSTDAEREFSKRRVQIEEALKEAGMTGAAASSVAALSTRQAKGDIDIEALRQQWQDAGKEFCLDNVPMHDRITPLDKPALADILREAHTNKSVSREQDIYTAAFQAAQGVGDAEQAHNLARESFDEAVNIGAGKDGKTRYSTQEIIAAERSIIDNAAKLAVAEPHQAIPLRPATEGGFQLSPEQQAARENLAGAGGIKVLVGDAGTGKSTLLAEVRQDYERAGYQVIGCAPSGKAAAGLSESAGIKAKTLDRLLLDIQRGETALHAKSLIVIDEAGMVDSRKMAAMMTAAESADAKIIAVGDWKQLQPVGSGATFAALAEAHGDPARLQEIFRQRDEWHKGAVSNMSKGDAAAAMSGYMDRGLVSIENTHKAAVAAVAEKLIEARKDVGADQVIGLASTNAAVNDINKAVRERLIEAGEITDVRRIETASKQLDVGIGDRLLVTKNDSETGLRNGDILTVKGIDETGHAWVHVDRGSQEFTADLSSLELNHGFAITTHKAQGATVDKAIILGSEHTSREAAYVQASRARDETQWVFSAAKVEKLAQSIENDTPPTGKMRDFAENLEQKRLEAGLQPSLTEDHRASFTACREWLNANAYFLQGDTPGGPMDPRLADLKQTIESMSRSQQKESTLDYLDASKTADKSADHEPERDMSKDGTDMGE
ncbi:MobF family relaxase [Thiomonas sp. X19]|uniref:MobF family relaxase n=1 Tax=Thiomonas sp. X19 TaxID=1050370 RepID=UPI001E389658|nr:MobF family relaxase [Thiomonas sp. X19]